MQRFLLESLTELDINNIINYYLSGKTTYETASYFKLSQSSIVKILKKNNIETKKSYDYYNNEKLNYNFFNKIDSEEKAYFLGLMFADGNNYKKKTKNSSFNVISINLQENDKYILEKFKLLLAPGYELEFLNKQKYNSSHKNQYRLRFSNKIISNQLCNLGCVPVKSSILIYPDKHIPKSLNNHFIRGYFDGDGTIYNYLPKKHKTVQFRAGIISSYNFCIKVNEIIKENINLSMEIQNRKYKNCTMYVSRIGGNRQVHKLMSWLYKDATVYLERKFNKFKELELLLKNKKD